MSRILMIAAPRSGSGKTTLTLSLLAAFRRRGLQVRALKTGPDYIDPAFHQEATGKPCANLDSWAMSDAALSAGLAHAGDGADLVIIESSMGLFDGLALEDGQRGAASDIAARFGLPVLLVLDASGQGQSVGAVAQGMATWSAEVSIGGVVLNNIASDRHEKLCRAAMRQSVLGVFRRDRSIVLPERHLGLVQARERGNLRAFFASLADKAERELDLDAILSLALPLREADPARGAYKCPLKPPGQRIALANDAAFSFLYAHLAASWREAGAEILPFSPLRDEAPAERADCCWLPGGYPELHAGPLANAAQFRLGMTRFAASHPVHGECGGFMVMGQGLIDATGTHHAMLGLLSHETSFARRKMVLGYREATLSQNGVLGKAGTRLRGHEFHYASVTHEGHDAPLAELRDGEGTPLGAAGAQRGRISGSFFHVLCEAQ
ncbi:cobyrinate a,c-diamide synthase [Asaia krungthepensis]|uniref:Cobyrinate a,c-diamide synthase n=1 Tax=Asaia krungthepensis NRIC 0535 TaxID=1307925 RepID=A0ABQ0Q048_9PROT|nr:cobyrinate a,c-diamide synthase [Asaia krungthepensis]GBQ85864.1 cobyrinic acid a,c-diamide synthase [Asaia krungthepensis NRIC 0535]